MKRLCVIVAIALLLTACGSENLSNRIQQPNPPGSTDSSATTGAAQGVYSGTYSFGLSFYAIVLPNDTFYAIDGVTVADDSMVQVWAQRTGPGRSNDGTYTAELTHFTSDRVFSSTLGATYVPATSLTGSLKLGTRTWHTFTAVALPASSLNFDTPANLSEVVGTWKAWGLCDVLVGGAEGGCEPYTAMISADGELTVPGSCVSGKITPAAFNKNFFDVKVTPGPDFCPGAGKTGTGVAVKMLLPDGVTQQLLLAGVLDGSPVVLVAQR